jgi:hypothetical protein
MDRRDFVCHRSGVIAVAVVAASLVGVPHASAADGWRMAGHDAARTSRSSVVSAQAPALLPGWPVSDEGFAAPLVAPNGTLVRPGGQFTAVMNRDGTLRRRLVTPGVAQAIGSNGGVQAIGLDGLLYGLSGVARLAAYTPTGRLLWRTSPLDAAPEASSRTFTVAPDGHVYWLAEQDTPVALDADGSRVWDSEGDCCFRAPVLAVGPTGTVYYSPPFRAASGLVARLPDGTTLWERAVGLRATRIAVADDGTVLVIDTEGVLHAFSPDGSERWSISTAPGASRMAIGADGSAYVVATGVVVAVGPDGGVRWTYRGAVTPTDPIIGGDGIIYLGGAPLVALRPDGSRAWRAQGFSEPLVPKAIGADGTLYAETRPALGMAYVPDRPLFALAGPAAPASVRIPVPGRRRVLISGLRVNPSRFRVRGAESLCVPGRGCRPTDPLGATVSFTLKRDAVVSVILRRVGAPRTVTRFVGHVRAGTMWRSFSDVTNHHALAPGRYTLTAVATSGASRVRTGSVPITVVR